MLFSKLVSSVSSGPLRATTPGNVGFLSQFCSTSVPFSFRPLSSKFLPEGTFNQCHNETQLAKTTYFTECHQRNLNIPSAIYTSICNWKYSSVVLCHNRTLVTIPTSVTALTVRPDIPGYCSVRMISDDGKDRNQNNKAGEGNGTGSDCNPTTNELKIKDGLQTRDSVSDFLNHLTDEQKKILYHSLNIEVLRDKYEGHLGSSATESHQFLSKFGRPAASLGGKEDPTGTLCEVSPKWLHARLGSSEQTSQDGQLQLDNDEKLRPPAAGAIWAVGVKNALPFIGFGFLDNLIMILAGDYIDITIGTTLGISTMAAAALGNTISDVAGIGSAWYIEEFASKIGIRDPELTPSQAASWPIRWACNGGRALGVVIGCLLGMVPLLFLPSSEDDKEKLAKSRAKREEDAKKASDLPPKDKN